MFLQNCSSFKIQHLVLLSSKNKSKQQFYIFLAKLLKWLSRNLEIRNNTKCFNDEIDSVNLGFHNGLSFCFLVLFQAQPPSQKKVF